MFKFEELFHNNGTNVYICNAEESPTVQTPVLQNTVIFVKKRKIIYIWKSEYVHNICTLFYGMEFTHTHPTHMDKRNY